MKKAYRVVQDVADRIETATAVTVEDYQLRRIEQEPAITDRLTGRIQDALDGYTSKGVRWTAKILTDRGRGAQESVYGADFSGVLQIELEDYAVRKGFLAQAKRLEPETIVVKSIYEGWKRQCAQMLELSPDSFLFLYSRLGVWVVPAIAIMGAPPCNPFDFYPRAIKRFYQDHLESFIGDHRISAPDIEALEALRQRVDARSLLLLAAAPA